MAYGYYYNILRGAFCVARFDKLGNAKASTRGTGNRIGSTFFMLLGVGDYKSPPTEITNPQPSGSLAALND